MCGGDALPGDEVHASTSAPFGRGGAKGLEFRLSWSVSRVEPKVIRGRGVTNLPQGPPMREAMRQAML